MRSPGGRCCSAFSFLGIGWRGVWQWYIGRSIVETFLCAGDRVAYCDLNDGEIASAKITSIHNNCKYYAVFYDRNCLSRF